MSTIRASLKASACKLLVGNVLLFGLANAGPAYAQPAASATSQGQVGQSQAGGSDGGIIVTATRRESSLNDVPLAVTALSGESLVKSGAAHFTDLAEGSWPFLC